LKLPKKILDVIVEEGSKIKLPSAEILGVLEITDTSSNGIENIKKKLQDLEKKGQNGEVVVSYIGAPKYRLSVTAPDFKSAEKILKPILEDTQKNIEKNKGTFKFTRQVSRKTGGI
jgi:translation initiation factor 2 subunit 1